MGENGFDALSTLENLSSGYQFISKFLKNTGDGESRSSLSSSGFGTSGVANCDDCFMGLRVSRREASVELDAKVAEWFAWLMSASLFPDPDLK
jgi:hypothetical protein